jgi:cytochrome c biogenesis protein CcdA/thiol-disulfide isomerase/thioredoxin
MIILVFFAFLSGIVTILSPCILPVLPIVLSGSVGEKKRPLGVILGFIGSFSFFTLILSTLVRTLNIPPDFLRITAVILIISFGLIMFIPKLKHGFEKVASRIANNGQVNKTSNGFKGGLITGFSLGLVWTPCVGPIIASVISLAITQSVNGAAVLIILAYSLGTSIPMFAIMTGGRTLIKRYPLLSKNPDKIQRIFGVLMILVGFSIASGLDRSFQSAILDFFPGYGTGLTAFENIDPVRNAINNLNTEKQNTVINGTNNLSLDIQPEKGNLGDYGPAPELISNSHWFNTKSQSINMESLRGKVVLIDFWTYSCINCIRTLPHLKSLYDKYGGDNFTIIGVHSPEFAFERKPENVQKAINDLGVNWPVILDNDFVQWNAYDNHYWPAHYFIDVQGQIRYFYFGEGQYNTAENVVRSLLEEAGKLPRQSIEIKEEVNIESRTAEIYLGFKRAKGFISKENIKVNKSVQYQPAGSPGNGQWNLTGRWTFKPEYIVPDDEGVLELGFNAKSVYIVIEPQSQNGWIEVELDGEKVIKTPDVQNGILQQGDSRLYQLINLPKAGKHILNLRVHGELRLYSFTFG